MIRYNFNASRASRAVSFLAYLRGDERRAPMLAIAVLLIGFGVTWGVEDVRLASETQNADALAQQQAIDDGLRQHVERIAANITMLESVQTTVADWRLTGLRNHDMFSGIADILARRSLSLTTLSDNGDTLGLAGAAISEAEVGRAVVALRRAPHIAHVQFLSTSRGAADVAHSKSPDVSFTLNLIRDTASRPAKAASGIGTPAPGGSGNGSMVKQPAGAS